MMLHGRYKPVSNHAWALKVHRWLLVSRSLLRVDESRFKVSGPTNRTWVLKGWKGSWSLMTWRIVAWTLTREVPLTTVQQCGWDAGWLEKSHKLQKEMGITRNHTTEPRTGMSFERLKNSHSSKIKSYPTRGPRENTLGIRLAGRADGSSTVPLFFFFFFPCSSRLSFNPFHAQN
jgi:hypothetical protein